MLTMGIWLIGCSSMKVSSLNAETKRFATQNKAAVLLSKQVDLDKHNTLLLMPEDTFLRGQMANIEYFKELITLDNLKVEIIREGLSDKVPSLTDAYGINKAAKAYKPFLWFRLNRRINLDGYYGQFILTNPQTFEDYFVAEIKLEESIKGTGDSKVWYPLFNALIDYIEQNSKSWGKTTENIGLAKKKEPKKDKPKVKKETKKVFNDKPPEPKVKKETVEKTLSDNNTSSVNGVKNLFTTLGKFLSKPSSEGNTSELDTY